MTTLNIELPFGANGRLACSVPQEQVVLYHVAPPALERLEDRVRERLTAPLDFPALSQAVLPDDRIVIALDEHTCGAPTLIRACWDVLESAGVEPGNVLILQAGGGAGAAPADPRCELVGRSREEVQWTRHDATIAKSRAYLASTTAGERIYLAREVIDADFVLCVGSIAYDPLLGYRGTSSVLYPGLSSEDAIRKARGQGHDELGPDDIRALRQTIDEVGWLLGVQFALQVIPAGRRGVADVIAGLCDSVFSRGKDRLAESWGIEIDDRPDTVVVTVDAAAERDAWGAVGAALETARHIVARDGRIVVLSDARAPLSPGLETIRDSRTPRDALQPLRMAVPEDVVAATQIARAVDWARVSLLSGVADDLVEDLFMTPLAKPQECRRIVEASRSIAFVESAAYAHVHRRVPV